MTKTKILILYTSVGYGIKVTAQNLGQQLSKNVDFEVRLEDIGQVQASRFGKLLEATYRKITDRFANLWGFMYRSRIILGIVMPLRKTIAKFQSNKTLELLREYQPAIVISTQAISTGIVAYLKSKGLYRGRLVAAFSDYHLHPFWCFDEVDLYLCNLAEQAEGLRKVGVSNDRIAVTGLFLGEKFYHLMDKNDAIIKMGLLQTMPKVLLFNGGRPRTDDTIETFLQLMRSPKSFQIVVICGTNTELKNRLEKLRPPTMHPVKIYGYSEEVDTLMTASDVMVGKTGGPTMGETVLAKLPLVLTTVKPGHEQENLDYLVKNQVADYGRIPRETVFIVEEILDGKRRRNWEQIAKKIIKPQGSVEAIDAINAIRPQTRVTHYQEQS